MDFTTSRLRCIIIYEFPRYNVIHINENVTPSQSINSNRGQRAQCTNRKQVVVTRMRQACRNVIKDYSASGSVRQLNDSTIESYTIDISGRKLSTDKSQNAHSSDFLWYAIPRSCWSSLSFSCCISATRCSCMRAYIRKKDNDLMNVLDNIYDFKLLQRAHAPRWFGPTLRESRLLPWRTPCESLRMPCL